MISRGQLNGSFASADGGACLRPCSSASGVAVAASATSGGARGGARALRADGPHARRQPRLVVRRDAGGDERHDDERRGGVSAGHRRHPGHRSHFLLSVGVSEVLRAKMPRPHGASAGERKVMGAVGAAARMASAAKARTAKNPAGMDRRSTGAALKQIKVTKGLRGLGIESDVNGVVLSLDPNCPAALAGELCVGDTVEQIDLNPVGGTVQQYVLDNPKSAYTFGVVRTQEGMKYAAAKAQEGGAAPTISSDALPSPSAPAAAAAPRLAPAPGGAAVPRLGALASPAGGGARRPVSSRPAPSRRPRPRRRPRRPTSSATSTLARPRPPRARAGARRLWRRLRRRLWRRLRAGARRRARRNGLYDGRCGAAAGAAGGRAGGRADRLRRRRL